MSQKMKNSLHYSRDDLTGMGASSLQVSEVETPGETITMNVNGKLIKLNTAVVREAPFIKPYVVIEKYKNMNLTTIDLLYGDIDIESLRKNEDARNNLFENFLTREKINEISRNYFGFMGAKVDSKGDHIEMDARDL